MLKINLEYRKGILFVRLKGELTKNTYKLLNEHLLSIVKEQGIKYIVFNLARVDYIDKYGKYSLKSIINETKKNYGKSLICNAKVKFDDRYKIIDNELMAFKTVKI